MKEISSDVSRQTLQEGSSLEDAMLLTIRKKTKHSRHEDGGLPVAGHGQVSNRLRARVVVKG